MEIKTNQTNISHGKQCNRHTLLHDFVIEHFFPLAWLVYFVIILLSCQMFASVDSQLNIVMETKLPCSPSVVFEASAADICLMETGHIWDQTVAQEAPCIL